MVGIVRFTNAMLPRPLSLAAEETPPAGGSRERHQTLDKVRRRMQELDQQIERLHAAITNKQTNMTNLRDRVVGLLKDKDTKLDSLMKGATASSVIGYGSFLGASTIGSLAGFGVLASSGPIGFAIIGCTALTGFCRYSTGKLSSQTDLLQKFSSSDVTAIIDNESMALTQNPGADSALVDELTHEVHDQTDLYLVKLTGDLNQRFKVEQQYQLVHSAAERTFSRLQKYEENLSEAIRKAGFIYVLPQIITGAGSEANANPGHPNLGQPLHPHAE